MVLYSNLKRIYSIANPKDWLIGDWQSLDPIFAGRLAFYAKSVGKKLILNETYRSSELQAKYYALAQEYQRTKKPNRYGIKYAAVPGSSSHEFRLAVDADNSHPIYQASNAELAKFGLCKPYLNIKEYWHIQPIEANSKSKGVFQKYAPTDMEPLLKRKFNFDQYTFDFIRGFAYPGDLAQAMYTGRPFNELSESTQNYLKTHKFFEVLKRRVWAA